MRALLVLLAFIAAEMLAYLLFGPSPLFGDRPVHWCRPPKCVVVELA